MTRQKLETTRQMCARARAAVTPACLDYWLATDALAAHDLLDLVRGMAADMVGEGMTSANFEKAQEWLDHG